MSSRPVPARLTLVVPALAAAAVLTACTGSEPAPPVATASSSPAATPSPAAPVAAEVACLEDGTWLLDVEEAKRQYLEGMQQYAVELSADYSGETVYEFTGGELTRTFTGVRELVRMVLVTQADVVAEQTQTKAGAAVAPYEATSTRIDVAAGDSSGVTFEEVVLENGVPWVPSSDRQEDVRQALAEPQTWLYTCTADTLHLTSAPDGVAPDPAAPGVTKVLHRR